MRLRKLTFNLHLYAGLIVGALLIVIGLTGTLLVFGHEIDHFLHPQLFQVVPQGERVSIESVLETVRAAYPDQKLQYINLPRTPDKAYEVWMKSGDDSVSVYVNPYSGAVLGSRQWEHSLIGFLFDLHTKLLAGERGEIIVGISGLLLLLLSVTGLILWSGWRRLAQGFTIKWQAHWQRVNFDLHKVSGILSVAFLALIASTGAAMSFYTQFEQAAHGLLNTPPLPTLTSTPQALQPPLALDEVLRKTDAALPGAETTMIIPASNTEGAVRVRKKLPQESHPNGGSNIYLDQYSGQVLRVENALEAPPATSILNSLYPLHIGSYGGLGMRIVYVFIGLAPAVLSITGFVMWWSRTYAIRRTRRR